MTYPAAPPNRAGGGREATYPAALHNPGAEDGEEAVKLIEVPGLDEVFGAVEHVAVTNQLHVQDVLICLEKEKVSST